MSLSGGYGKADDDDSLKVLAKAIKLGCTFWDTAQVYGNGHNEELIGRFLKENPGAREKLFIGSKCGFNVCTSLTVLRLPSSPICSGHHPSLIAVSRSELTWNDRQRQEESPTSQTIFTNPSKHLPRDSEPSPTYTTCTESTPIRHWRKASQHCRA